MSGVRSSEMMKWQSLWNVAAQLRETPPLIAVRQAFTCQASKMPGLWI